MFKNILVYKIGADWQTPDAQGMEEVLQRTCFAPCSATQEESYGWVSPRPQDHSPFLEVVAGQWLMKLQVERKSVPAGAVRAELEARCKKIEQELGRKASRKEKKELKEDIVLEFLPRAFSKRYAFLVWLDPVNHFLVVGTSSRRAADEVVEQVVEAFSTVGATLPIQMLTTQAIPADTMAFWLTEKEAPAGFTVDRDLELRQPDNEQSVVRYARHNLEIEEVVQHIASGKKPTQLAMTWDSRVSFTLGADLSVKKIQMLDDVFVDSDEDSGFDGDAALATAEISRLLLGLIEALGGEAQPQTAEAASDDSANRASAQDAESADGADGDPAEDDGDA